MVLFVVEGLDLSQVPMRPRGRPCRFFGDLMSQIQEGQNSRDSGSGGGSSNHDVESVINGHLQEAQMLMNNENNATAAAAQAAQAAQAAHAAHAAAVVAAAKKKAEEVFTVMPRAPEDVVTVIPRAPEDVVTVIPRAPEETAAEEEAAASEPPHPQAPDERALSLSVELAAVNQAILSLTGQQPIGGSSSAAAAAAAAAAASAAMVSTSSTTTTSST